MITSQVFFTQEDVTNIPEAEKWDADSFLDDLVITEDQVKKKLKGLKIDKSPGPDGMYPRILKELSDMIAGPLCILFNKSVLERALPQEWKDGHVTPIFKKGSKSDRANYRPVTLTSIVCKVMEHFVREAVLNHMRKHLVECQHGFIGGRSCTTNLLEVIDFWTKILDEGHALDVIYLDFSKAFDTVPHQRLLRKLINYGIRGNVLGWIQDFLSDRRQRVMVSGSCSNWSPVLSGIPQGSVLGPVLFICYVNDMPGVIENGISMLADDAKLFSSINDDLDSQGLQNDLNKLQAWAQMWQLRFNASKCKVMHLGKKNAERCYNMKDGPINVTLGASTCEKDLGVHVDNKLKFNVQAEVAANKGNKILGIIRRSFTYLDRDIMTQLFKALVRPHLEYGNSVWSPFYKKDITVIENVQRRATKLITELKDVPYQERLWSLNLPSLVYRRLRGDLIEPYKYTHNHYNIESDKLLPRATAITRGHSLKLSKQRFNLDVRKRF